MSSRTFNTDDPLAYFITWTTYGTWLPGDDRGWRRRDSPNVLSPSELHTEVARADMTESEFRMSPSDRETVQATIE